MRSKLGWWAVLLASCAPPTADETRPQTQRPPPLSAVLTPLRAAELTGGSLAVGADGHTVAVADADHQRVFLYDVSADHSKGTVDLNAVPGRIVAMPDGSFVVALRSTGEVAHLSPSLDLTRTYACPEPRGLAFDANQSGLWVACAGGELMFQSSDGSMALVTRATEGLRDVLPTADGVTVTAFRTGNVYTLQNGALVTQASPPSVSLSLAGNPTWTPGTAYRSVPMGAGYVMVHQRAFDGHDGDLAVAMPDPTSQTSGSAYGGSSTLPSGVPCTSPVVRSVITVGAGSEISASMELKGVTPLDLAVSPDGKQAAVAMAGSGQVRVVSFTAVGGTTGGDSCQLDGPVGLTIPVPGEPDGVGFLPDGRLVTHVVRDGAHVLQVNTVSLPVEGPSTSAFLGPEVHPINAGQRDTFHLEVNQMACASCHPEGHDDGHVWNLIAHTARTQSLAGGLLATAPFHWDGKLADVGAVMNETFVHRMGGKMPAPSQVTALGKWLDGVQPVRRVTGADGDLIARGQELFNSTQLGCVSCHPAPTFTNNLTVDVGTGGSFQVPSLRGVGERGPWMHDGCAASLRDRFTNPACGGTLHGNVTGLSDADVDALVAYLDLL